MGEFKKPYAVRIGGQGVTRELSIGGDAPVSIQTMWKSPLPGADLQDIARTLGGLEQLGCDIVRFAVPDMESADALVLLSEMTPMPLVADIHFDYRLALRCLDGNVAKIRINPGNIGSEDRVRAVVEKATDRNAAIRIGVNSGSLPRISRNASSARGLRATPRGYEPRRLPRPPLAKRPCSTPSILSASSSR